MGLALLSRQTLLRSSSIKQRRAVTGFTVLGQASLVRFWITIWRRPLVLIDQGVIITDLHPASPFRTVGFEVGDVITAVDGQPVISGGEMLFRMSVGALAIPPW